MEIKLSGGYTLDAKKKTQDRKKGSHLKKLPIEFCIIDIETTGFDSQNDSIIELSALRIKSNQIVETFSTLVKPNKTIPDFISNLTQITNEMVETAPDLKTGLQVFQNFIGNDVLFGHNINFDINFIYDCQLKLFNDFFDNDYVDFLTLSKQNLALENYKLETIAKHLGVKTENSHRGLQDCLILLECYLKTCK